MNLNRNDNVPSAGRKTNFRKIVKSVIFYGFSIYVCI